MRTWHLRGVETVTMLHHFDITMTLEPLYFVYNQANILYFGGGGGTLQLF